MSSHDMDDGRTTNDETIRNEQQAVNDNGLDTVPDEDCTESTPFISSNNDPPAQRQPFAMYTLAFFAALGGFLFGYDTGVISGALLPLKRLFNLSDIWRELIVSATIGAAVVGAVSGGWFNSKFGRKIVLITSSVIFTAGAVIMAVAPKKEVLLLGRLVVGIAIGYASTTCPMYVAECAPAEIRGKLITVYQLFITFGQFSASVIDGLFSKDEEHGWRYMLGIGGFPAVIMMLGMLLMPESPRYLVHKGKIREAEKVLRRLRATEMVKKELDGIIISCQKDDTNETENILRVFARALRTSYTRRALIVGCGLQAIQQLCGINTVMYYSATIIALAGIGDEQTAIWLAAVVAAGNFVFSFVALFLVERAGRLKLTLLSLFGVIVSLCLLAATFVVIKQESPRTMLSYPGDVCARYQSCYDCVKQDLCGFCYANPAKGKYINGSCLSHAGGKTPSACNSTTLQWAENACPTNYAWLAVFSMVLYLAAFAPGMGPMPWAINAEIYPLWARSVGTACSTSANWLFNLVVSITFLNLISLLSRPGAFIFYACLSAIGWIFLFLLLPETKGKSLEDIEELFKGRLVVRCKEKD